MQTCLYSTCFSWRDSKIPLPDRCLSRLWTSVLKMFANWIWFSMWIRYAVWPLSTFLLNFELLFTHRSTTSWMSWWWVVWYLRRTWVKSLRGSKNSPGSRSRRWGGKWFRENCVKFSNTWFLYRNNRPVCQQLQPELSQPSRTWIFHSNWRTWSSRICLQSVDSNSKRGFFSGRYGDSKNRREFVYWKCCCCWKRVAGWRDSRFLVINFLPWKDI